MGVKGRYVEKVLERSPCGEESYRSLRITVSPSIRCTVVLLKGRNRRLSPALPLSHLSTA